MIPRWRDIANKGKLPNSFPYKHLFVFSVSFLSRLRLLLSLWSHTHPTISFREVDSEIIGYSNSRVKPTKLELDYFQLEPVDPAEEAEGAEGKEREVVVTVEEHQLARVMKKLLLVEGSNSLRSAAVVEEGERENVGSEEVEEEELELELEEVEVHQRVRLDST